MKNDVISSFPSIRYTQVIPSHVLAVLTGCLIVLLKANASSHEPIPEEGVEERRMSERRKRASIILYSQVKSVAPNITATAAYARKIQANHHRASLPTDVVRSLQLNDDEMEEVEDMSTMSRYDMFKRAVTAPIGGLRRLSNYMTMKDYGSMDLNSEDEEE